MIYRQKNPDAKVGIREFRAGLGALLVGEGIKKPGLVAGLILNCLSGKRNYCIFISEINMAYIVDCESFSNFLHSFHF